MNPGDSLHQRLLRGLDGHLPPTEQAALETELHSDPEARATLRDLAEQAVMMADLARATDARRSQPRRPPPPILQPTQAWIWGLTAAACLVLALGASALWFRAGASELGRVVKVTGASGFFGTRGAAKNIVQPGIRLRAGDALETRSCDSWIDIELRDGTQLTIAGQSRLRMLTPNHGTQRLELPYGSLWTTPATPEGQSPLSVQTPTALLETRGAQYDVQASAGGALLRVNGGTAKAIRTLDGATAQVTAGQQCFLTFHPGEDPQSVPQPPPVTSWAVDVGGVPEVILGRWLPPNDHASTRLAAVPLLWPIPDQPPVTLHAVALSVIRDANQPVLLQPDSMVHFHGQTSRPHQVRFGFSTQRMRGVFTGKFELDIPASELGPPGQPWAISRSIADFQPLQPHLAASPQGLELYDVYALTIQVDAGLEIHHVELGPAEVPR